MGVDTIRVQALLSVIVRDTFFVEHDIKILELLVVRRTQKVIALGLGRCNMQVAKLVSMRRRFVPTYLIDATYRIRKCGESLMSWGRPPRGLVSQSMPLHLKDFSSLISARDLLMLLHEEAYFLRRLEQRSVHSLATWHARRLAVTKSTDAFNAMSVGLHCEKMGSMPSSL